MNPIETDADVGRAWVAALSDEQIDYPIHTTLSEDELSNYVSDARVIATIARNEIKGLIAEELNFMHVERTQAKVQNHLDETLVHTLQRGKSVASKGSKWYPPASWKHFWLGFSDAKRWTTSCRNSRNDGGSQIHSGPYRKTNCMPPNVHSARRQVHQTACVLKHWRMLFDTG